MNTVTFTGASGTPTDRVAASIGDSLLRISRLDASTQTWQSFIPGAAAATGTLDTVNQGNALILDRKSAAAVKWVDTDIVGNGKQQELMVLWPGLNTIAMTSVAEVDLATLFGPVSAHIESVQRFNPGSQRWDSWVPSAPA